LVRITVLVVGGSTVGAFGAGGVYGMGLESWAWSVHGPTRQAAAIKVQVQFFMRLQGFAL
jgi:hypothetical protein